MHWKKPRPLNSEPKNGGRAVVTGALAVLDGLRDEPILQELAQYAVALGADCRMASGIAAAYRKLIERTLEQFVGADGVPPLSEPDWAKLAELAGEELKPEEWKELNAGLVADWAARHGGETEGI